MKIDPFTISPGSQAGPTLRGRRGDGAGPRTVGSPEQPHFHPGTEDLRQQRRGHGWSRTIFEAGGGIQATAVGEGEVQRRSYPQSFGRQQGWRRLGIRARHGTGGKRRTHRHRSCLLVDRRPGAPATSPPPLSLAAPNWDCKFTSRAATPSNSTG